MNQIVNMVIRLVMRKLLNKGIDAGFDRAAQMRSGKTADKPQLDDDGNRSQAQSTIAAGKTGSESHPPPQQILKRPVSFGLKYPGGDLGPWPRAGAGPPTPVAQGVRKCLDSLSPCP